jgi:hypothetical protein
MMSLQAFHQECYQARYSKRCCRCTKVRQQAGLDIRPERYLTLPSSSQVLKGKVVKALDSLYHPDCFVCYQCSSSLSGTAHSLTMNRGCFVDI